MAAESEVTEISLHPVNQTEKPTICLHHAARDNREEVVDKWIEIYAAEGCSSELNRMDSFGYTPLHYAAKFNRFNILVNLVEAGADTNIQSEEEGLTALHFSARYTPRIVDLLVQQQESEEGESSERQGSKLTSARAMLYLVSLKGSNKVKVNQTGRYGLSALHLACQRGNHIAVSVLLRSNDIDTCVTDKNNDTPLHEACLSGYDKIVEKLMQRLELEDPTSVAVKANLKNYELQTPLHLACREGYNEVVNCILKHIPEFGKRSILTKTRDNEENTPLHLACESGKEEIVRILVLNGADLMSVRRECVSPMHIAARYGYTAVAKTLLTGSNIVDLCNDCNQTPLHFAASHNQVEMISFLISQGADISATDSHAYTPLMLAASEGHVDAFRTLLEKGASIDGVDKNGETIVHLAASGNHVDLLRCILKIKDGYELVTSTDSSYNTPLHEAALKGNIDCVNILLTLARATIRVDAKNELNKTPLHLAASMDHTMVMQALINHQKDCILDEDEDGNTPLHLACYHGHHRAVNVLLENEADYDAKNAVLWSPLDAASCRGHTKVVQVLIDAGADVNPTDKQQTTPLHHAAQEGHLHVVQILLKNGAKAGHRDVNKHSSLDMAIDNGHENIAMAIIKSDQWESALRSTSTSHGNITTPLRKLIKRMPEVAEEVLNLCSMTNATKDGRIRPDSKDYQVVFNYEFLEDFVDERKSYFSWFWNCVKGKDNEVTNSESSEALLTSSHYAKKVDVTETFELAVSKKNYFTSWGPVGFKKELHPLSIMVDNNCTDLLKHPLVKSLLNLKWRTYGRTAYFLNLFIFILFVTFLTTFALVSLNPQSSTCRAVFNGSFGAAMQDSTMYRNDTSGCVAVMVNMSNTANASGLLSGTEVCASNDSRISCGLSNERCGICEGQDFVRKGFLFIAAAIVIAFALIRLTFELFQSFALKFYYFLEWVNFVEIILFVCAIIFSFVFTTDCLCPTVWQWQIGCIAVFLAWIDFIIFVRKLPLTGIYVLMLVHIFYTFMKMIFLTMLLLIAFSLAFYMAFYDPSEAFARASFATPGRAIVKTMTMTTGEFEYDSIFRQFPGGAGDDDITREIPFPPLSYILWIIFLIMMPILLTNLLVGLAVDDIKGIQDAAVLQRLALQVELALSVEELLPSGLRRYFIKRSNVVYPNRKLNTIEMLRFNVFGTEADRFDSSENISNALHPALTPIEQVQVQTDHLRTDVKHMKDAIHDLVERNIMMERLIRELVNRPAAEAYKSDNS